MRRGKRLGVVWLQKIGSKYLIAYEVSPWIDIRQVIERVGRTKEEKIGIYSSKRSAIHALRKIKRELGHFAEGRNGIKVVIRGR